MPFRPDIAAGLAGLACAASAQAQETPAPTPVAPVVVTATKVVTPLNQIGSSITLITAEDIERNQWRTLPDALADVPGLNVVQTGGPGGQTSVFIRGANSNQTKVIIDGIDVNDPSIGAFDFGQVLTSDIARIEVLRGPGSSLYGSDALGGVINIVTRKGEGPAHLDASLEGGSFDTFNQTLGVAGSASKMNYTFNVDHLRTADTPVTPLGLLASGEARNDDRYDNLTLSTKLGFDVSDRLGLDLTARYTDSWLSFTGENYDLYPSPPRPDAAQTVQHDQQVFARLQASVSLFDGAFKNVFGAAVTDYQDRSQSPDDGFGLPPANTSFGNRVKFDWQGNISLGPDRTLVLGAEDAVDRIDSSPIDAHNADAAGYAELSGRVAGDLFAAASVRYDDNGAFGGKTTWRIAPTYTIAATGTQLKASYGTGFKAPTLCDLYCNFPFFSADPYLKPEQSRGFDVGFEQPVWTGRARFGATYFHNSITDLIEANPAGTTLVNIARATTYGVESFVSVTLTPQLNLRSDYTYTVATDDANGAELLRRPKQKVDVTGSWRATDRLTLTATGLYVGWWSDYDRSASTVLRASPYFVANVAASYDVGQGLELFGRIDNVLDRHYADPYGFQRPGIGAFIGVRVRLGPDRGGRAG